MDRVHQQLQVSAKAAEELAKEGHQRGRLGHEGGLVERDAMVFQAAKRIAQLDAAHEGLVFGRLDLDPQTDPQPRYIGRIGLRDANRDSLLIDWRAPAAAVFYQATAAEPQSVVRRRVLRCTGATVLGVEDELLDPDNPAAEDAADRRRGRADGAAVPGPRPVDALDRGDHPGRAGHGDPGAQQGRGLDLRRPRHRQDRGGAAPRGVPALHRPAPLRGRRRADRRPQRGLHALHRAGAAQPRRDRGGAAFAGRGGRRRPRHPPRRARGGRRQGLGADGRADAAHRPPAGAGQPARVPHVLARRPDRARPRRARPDPAPADVAGPAQPAAAPGRERHARRDVAAGARRARPRAGPRGVRRRHAVATRRSSTSRWPGGRRWTRPTVLAWLRDPEFLARVAEGVVTSEEQRLLTKSWDAAQRRCRWRTCRCSTSCATRSATCRRAPTTSATTRYTLLEGAVDIQELMTAADREYAPTGRAWTPPTHSIEDDAVRARAGRRGAGPHADAVADGRPARPGRVLDDRRRPGAVVVARAGGVGGGPGGRPGGQAASTSSTCRRTTATPRRSTRSPRRTPSGSGSTPTCRRRSGRPGVPPVDPPGVSRPRDGDSGGRARGGRSGARHRRHRGARRPAARR